LQETPEKCVLFISAIKYRQLGRAEWQYVPLLKNASISLEADAMYEFKASFDDMEDSQVTITWQVSGVRIRTNMPQITFYKNSNLLMYASSKEEDCKDGKEAVRKVPILLYPRGSDPTSSLETSTTAPPQKRTSQPDDRTLLPSPLLLVFFIFVIVLLCVSIVHNRYPERFSWNGVSSYINSHLRPRRSSLEQIEMTHCITSQSSYC